MNLTELSIEQFADLRDEVISTLNDRVSARQRQLLSETERLAGISWSESRKGGLKAPSPHQFKRRLTGALFHGPLGHGHKHNA
ncbi:MAG: hypothetical protein ABI561_06765 [Bradyrhizobium sp.]